MTSGDIPARQAAVALVQIGTPDAIKAAVGAVPALIQVLQDQDEDVRRSAALALGDIGADAIDAVPALIPDRKSTRLNPVTH